MLFFFLEVLIFFEKNDSFLRFLVSCFLDGDHRKNSPGLGGFDTTCLRKDRVSYRIYYPKDC